MDEREQWKLSGNCEKCRRKNYCGTKCKAAMRADKAEVAVMAASIMMDIWA